MVNVPMLCLLDVSATNRCIIPSTPGGLSIHKKHNAGLTLFEQKIGTHSSENTIF